MAIKEIRYRINRQSGEEDRLIDAITSRIDALAGAVHREGDSCLQVWRVHGSPEDLEEFKRLWVAQRRPPLQRVEVLEDRPRVLLLVAQWSRPVSQRPLTAEDILASLAWTPLLIRTRMRDHHIEVQALGGSGPDLLRSFTQLKKHCPPGLSIDLIRIGEVQAQKDSVPPEAPIIGFDQEDARILDLALVRGYYDIPRRCGVRELAEELGICKSLIAKRLRILERETLRRFRDESRSASVEGPAQRDGPVHAMFT